MKILILYTEIAQYVTSSLRYFLQQNPQSEIHLIKYPVNAEAPFVFENEKNLNLYNRNDFDKNALVNFSNKLSPDLILCSGWIDKEYLSVCKVFRKKIPVVLVMDNHWNGSIKQQILRFSSPLTIHNRFNNVWVPGLPQKEYALKLGFKEKQIKTGFYCGDTSLYNHFYETYKEEKYAHFPKRFICVARYIPAKGLENLWKAFSELKDSGELKDWELWCLGTGQDFDKKAIHEGICHFGFVQPSDMGKFLKETGIFVLPSLYEPWAVVVHEFAAAGFPLILSSAVGAGSMFLENGENGFRFSPNNLHELKEKLCLMATFNQEQYNKMADLSFQLSKRITSDEWSKTLLKFN
ncbi:MAG: glycosyltransferase family 4 protein [Bacteroidetes bacterium]|nr:glycosyltransferase family 4 protein [Bacteroidota bacterium]